MLHLGLRIATYFPSIIEAYFPSMGVLWWMEASLRPILISPWIFIMAPRVTPARCMKCPASCHSCPLSLYLCNIFLLPSLPLFHSLSSTHFYLFGSFRRHKCLFSPYKCDVSLEPRRGCVLFLFSKSIILIVSVFLAVGLPLFLTDTLQLSLPFLKTVKERVKEEQGNILSGFTKKKENLASDMSTPTLPC